ncbi:MAG: PD-(D/E)XK nuclease-like domain-containing protein [Planctomycetota bacterium]
MTVAETSNLFLREPAEVYHRQAQHYLSSHQLADFRKCPLLYHRKRTGQFVEPERPAYTFGRAAHTLILEGLDRFEEEFAVGGPINPKTNLPFGTNTKAWADWEASVGKPVLSDEQAEMIGRMNESVRMHPAAMELLAAGQAEAVLRSDYCNMPCQIRMDWCDAHAGLVDLKTCDDLTWFEADARRYGYAHQLAFYRAMLATAIGILMPVHLIAVEKKEPYRCGVWRLAPDTLALAQRDNEAAIDRLKACLAEERWPTGYEETRLFDFL